MSDALSDYIIVGYTLNYVNHSEVIMNRTKDKKMLTVSDIFDEYGIKPALVYHWVRFRKFQILKINKKILIQKCDFEEFLEAHAVPGEIK